ncbi:hypothetical protein [Stenotrophomonas maltophilia]|uniref:hypothetical protein n=1 Tax=Stenotrophomonas maltophilia TaxID=40324 RepID=UPI0039C3261D
MRLDFNEDSPKRNAEPRRAAMVAQTHLIQQATARDVFVLVLSQSRWKMSKSADGGEQVVSIRMERGRHFCMSWLLGQRIMPSKMGAFATTMGLTSAPG